MVKILLVCAAGMSTSLLVENMKKAAAERGLEAQIDAWPIADFERVVADYDVALLGPQVRYKLSSFQRVAESHGIPIEVIDMVAYGTVNGGKVVDQALKLLGK